MMLSNRMTENNLLATAAAAMVTKIISLSRPLVLRPLSPSKKNLLPVPWLIAAILNERIGEINGWRRVLDSKRWCC